MREGWETTKLGAISEIFRGGSPRPIKSFITQEADGINWIKIGDTEVGGKYIYSTEEKIRKEGMRSSRYVEPGDFLLSNSMSFGRPYILKTDGCIHDGWLVIKKYERTLDQDFLYYLLLSPVVAKQFKEGARGSTVRNLNTDIVSSVVVSYPVSHIEQQRIVAVLDQEFAKIDALKANAEKSLQAAKDLFQATTDTMMGNERWGELTIGEIAKIKGGKRIPKGYKLEKEPTAHRYIRVADFTDRGTVRPESVLYISDEVYKTIKAYTISSKDVYISIAGTIGKSGIIPDALDGANLTENACKLVLGPAFYNRFVFFATKTSSFKKQVETLTMQAAQPKLALTRLSTIRVRVPSSIQEQETVVARLDGIADTISLLQDNYQKTLSLCDDLKQSLLRKAFNGEMS